MVSIIWITRQSEQEDKFLAEYLDRFGHLDVERMIVGHTNIPSDGKNFTYVPFFEFGIDQLGLICHKKNIGVARAKYGPCLVLHADARPDDSFFDWIKRGEHLKHNLSKSVICPLGETEEGYRSLTWCNYAGQHKDLNQPEDDRTYISGGAIFGTQSFFLRNPWDQNLRHNMEEDWQFCRTLRAKGLKSICDPTLKVIMKNSQ